MSPNSKKLSILSPKFIEIDFIHIQANFEKIIDFKLLLGTF